MKFYYHLSHTTNNLFLSYGADSFSTNDSINCTFINKAVALDGCYTAFQEMSM